MTLLQVQGIKQGLLVSIEFFELILDGNWLGLGIAAKQGGQSYAV